MPDLIVIRLHPVEPTSGADFANYLTDLTITAFDISFGHLEGEQIGRARFLPADPAQHRIFQHFQLAGFPPVLVPQAVATAVIEVTPPAGHPEHSDSDIILRIERGSGEIIHRNVYYNVPVSSASLPTDSDEARALQPTSLHLALPVPGREVSPTDAFVELPADGSPPNFADLKAAVNIILSGDPGGGTDIDTLVDPGPPPRWLTSQQSRHIAYEIVWNQEFHPLPDRSTDTLENIYTSPSSDSDESTQERKTFEAELAGYYAIHNAEAESLARFVFSLSAAVFCEAESARAKRVGFRFPVRPGTTGNTIKIKEAEVVLKGDGGADMDPEFIVPAEYFYALGAAMSPQVAPPQRYRMATLENEERSLGELTNAIELGVINEPAANRYQAARRLRSLGVSPGVSPECEVEVGSALHSLVQDWLDFTGADIAAFWTGAINAEGHLDLVLCAITGNHEPLIAAIKAIPITNVNDLAARTAEQWRALLLPNPALLPPFTQPGTAQERTEAFIRHVRKFFDATASAGSPPSPTVDAPPVLGRSLSDPIQRFIDHYNADPGPDFAFGSAWNEALVRSALNAVFPADPDARAWLEQVLRTIDELYRLADVTPPTLDDLRFSVTEALYARGFTSRQSVREMSLEDFRDALTGTVAYEFADAIYQNASGAGQPGEPEGEFRPINPDGALTNCIPPPHLSPLGPVAYLYEMLKVSEFSTCGDPFPAQGVEHELRDLIAGRRGPLGDLHVTRTNLETPLPLIDLVNECLESIAGANLPGPAAGVVYDTNENELGGHKLRAYGPQPAPVAGPDVYHHDPVTLFEALPEHSSPATPVKKPDAYDNLKSDFTSPLLPYSQPLDINRSYLRQLGTSRYATMRRFRKEITEFVLDPNNEPAEFQRHLWRYPVRIEIAREYLYITPEEYDLFFTKDIVETASDTELDLPELYGFTPTDVNWMQTVVILSEFLDRAGLTYCEFFELWKSEFVRFWKRRRPGDSDRTFPECEPCYLDKILIQFVDPANPNEALKRLAVFIRLWRKLQLVEGAKYSFTELRDICEVLKLFNDDGTINPEFIRQLAAFQILRDRFGLALRDEMDDLPGTGADRTHLLALWVGETARKWNWAVDELLDRIQYYAQARHKCGCRHPEFIRLLAENLDPLSLLAGFDPGNDPDTWHALPTHTLRFAEILAKIYASDFGIGEILFLFTADDHLDGDDPFPLQTQNEALDSPLDLPDDEDEYSLWELRRKLLWADVSYEEAAYWTWPRIVASLQDEFCYVAPAGAPDPLYSLGEHFFPSILEECDYPVDLSKRQYRAGLAGTSAQMWNTPPDGPFRYDTAKKELYTQLPLTDEAVIAKLSRIRQLSVEEQRAVRELYFLPRVDLATFAFIFANFAEADERLIQEADEAKRWAYFQREFARCHKRSEIIAGHLAGHVAAATNRANTEGIGLAWRLLKCLFADENRAKTTWEADNGQVPEVTWNPQPNGGAFAALLGLTGTGLLGEFATADNIAWEDDKLILKEDQLAWREVRGPMDAFGPEENASNSPVPTILPSMSLTFTRDQERFASVRNGFAILSPDGRMLGGAQGFAVRWRGALIVENEGKYEFRAGSPTPDGEEPDFKSAKDRRWRVTLKRGQKTWTLLSHNWPDVKAPAACSEPLTLKRGAYQLIVEFVQPQPAFDSKEDVCPQTTGFQLKYSGPDSAHKLVAVPLERLFRDYKNNTLGYQIALDHDSAAKRFLETHFTSALRDIRRTYQRAFKALLFAHRFGLSAKPEADDGQSEIGYMLDHADDFVGTSYFRAGAGFNVHRAYFDFNFLPLKDNYHSPTFAQDQRVRPSDKRQQALFDWWERAFDYTTVRREAQTAPERPVWLLFHEAAEAHPDDPAHLLRHMGVDFRHAALVLRYYQGYDVTSADLEDERWAVRVWQAEKWIRDLLARFFTRDIRDARPDLWASDDPGVVVAGETQSGNANLTKFYRDGCIENGEPRRYEEIKRLNDGLRERARWALLAYLCGMNRVELPWGVNLFAEESKHLSELLLLDVEAGLCQRASRIEEAITAVQIFIQRARLGLEPGFNVSEDFVFLWDRRFVTFHIWEACKRREIYRENWIDWDELREARRSEAFRFLEDQLRRVTLTIAAPGGLEYWPNARPPIYPGLTLLQAREPALIERLDPAREGFDLLGEPERHARPSWLASLHVEDGIIIEGPDTSHPPGSTVPPNTSHPDNCKNLPFWIEAAIRLGVRFVRVAAAGEPPASTTFDPRRPGLDEGCCVQCGRTHKAVIDEYYFWLLDSRYYDEVPQDADWGASEEDPESDWHDEEELPSLLHWASKRMVHLMWCRFHNGEFQQPRRSFEGVRINPNHSAPPELEFLGRTGDSLNFEVEGGEAPPGYTTPPEPGFRYDLATDTAVVLPLIAEPTVTAAYPGGLPAYPYFAYFEPGAPLVPPSFFSTALTVAGSLRAHCRFEAALKWYECVFNPLHEDNTWSQCPRGRGDQGEVPTGGTPVEQPTGEGEDAACCQNSVVSDEVARDRSITLHYLETLLHWGDAVMRRNSPEAFQQARLIFDTAARILGERPHNVIDAHTVWQTVALFDPHFAPLNTRLLALYDLVEDRLTLIHACLNARRLRNGRPNKDMPYWGNTPTHGDRQIAAHICHGGQTMDSICADEDDWCCLHSPYRFMFLVQKAQEIANEVSGLGAALLAAFEKGDAEYLASLRASHERQLLNLALEIRRNQWREADWQTQALRKTKEIAQTRRRYFATLIQNGLIGGEQAYQALTASSLASRTAGNISETIAQAMGGVPDTWSGVAGIAGTPLFFTQLPIGTKLAGVFATAARIANTLAEIFNTTASLNLTEAGWVRREDEWRHQVEVLDIEIEQIERQILAAERRRDIALRELNNHQRQIEHSAEIQDFLRDKFTNHALFLWQQKETAALHYQMYELALHAARQAERAFNYERGHTTRRFLPADAWDNLHEGLLAGERLQLSVRQMEKAYLDENVREYELTKHISLRLHFPMAFLILKATGSCEIEVPEWMFDLDYPGHYMRRIKNVTLTLPCVVGPYTGVHCRLTLLSGVTRVDPRLSDPPGHCCSDDKPANGYLALPDDPRIVAQYAATEAIATSSGQNDSGMFELNFRDERYLPFEFAGAVSRWRLELPQENNQFDVDTLSDVILSLNYMAREGGDVLRRVANEAAQQNLPGAGLRLFDVKHELPDAWRLFQNCFADGMKPKQLGLRLGRNMFPFLPGRRDLWINRLELFIEAPGAEPSANRVIEFLADRRLGHMNEDGRQCEAQNIYCVASAEWPRLYHGVLDVRLGPLGQSGHREIGTFTFPPDIGEVSRIYLFCGYNVAG